MVHFPTALKESPLASLSESESNSMPRKQLWANGAGSTFSWKWCKLHGHLLWWKGRGRVLFRILEIGLLYYPFPDATANHHLRVRLKTGMRQETTTTTTSTKNGYSIQWDFQEDVGQDTTF